MAAGCKYFGKGKAREVPPAPAPPVVQVIEAKPQAVKIYSEWVAQTYSQEAVEVRARVNGYIEERRFNPGDLVKQGDILDRTKGDLAEDQPVVEQGGVVQAVGIADQRVPQATEIAYRSPRCGRPRGRRPRRTGARASAYPGRAAPKSGPADLSFALGSDRSCAPYAGRPTCRLTAGVCRPTMPPNRAGAVGARGAD